MIYLFGNDMCCVFIVYATIFFKAVGDISMEMEELGEDDLSEYEFDYEDSWLERIYVN